MRSRIGPPKSSYTGAPSALPLMSHSAISMPLMADICTTPPRTWKWWYSVCQCCSILPGSLPISWSPNSSIIVATAKGPDVASPQPVMPSSVSTFTNM